MLVVQRTSITVTLYSAGGVLMGQMSAASDLTTLTGLAGPSPFVACVTLSVLYAESLRFYTLQVKPPWDTEQHRTRRESNEGALNSPHRLFEGAVFYTSLVLAAFGLHWLVCLRWDLSVIHMVCFCTCVSAYLDIRVRARVWVQS